MISLGGSIGDPKMKRHFMLKSEVVRGALGIWMGLGLPVQPSANLRKLLRVWAHPRKSDSRT